MNFIDELYHKWGDKLKLGIFAALSLVGAVCAYEDTQEELQLNNAPSQLGTVEKLYTDRRGKGTPTHYVYLRLQSAAPADSLVQVKVKSIEFEQLHRADTLAIRYLTQSRRASIYPIAPSYFHYLLLGFGLLCAYALLSDRWKNKLRLTPRPRLWHSAGLLLSSGLMVIGLKGCTQWAGQYSYLRPYHYGHHLPGRVIAVSPIDTSSLVLVAFRPHEDSLAATAYTRWMPAPAFYHDLYSEAVRLGWKPKVEVWYPNYKKEKAHLLVMLKPDNVDNSQAQYFFMLTVGFVILVVQIKRLENLVRKSS